MGGCVLTLTYRETEWDQLVLISESVALENVSALTAECCNIGVNVGSRVSEEATAYAWGVATLSSKQSAVKAGLTESPNRLCWDDRLHRVLQQTES